MSCLYQGCGKEIEFNCITCSGFSGLCLDHFKPHIKDFGHKVEIIEDETRKRMIFREIKMKIKQCIQEISTETKKLITEVKEASGKVIQNLKNLNKNLSSVFDFKPIKFDFAGILKLKDSSFVGEVVKISQPMNYFSGYDEKIQSEYNSQAFYNDRCAYCKKQKQLDQIIISCKHLCNDCSIEFMKYNQYNCYACKIPFKESDMNKLSDLKKECFRCERSFNILKGIINAECGHSYCMACLDKSKMCLMTHTALKVDPNLIIPPTKKCDMCKNNYKLLESNDLKRVCKCNYCNECLELNMEKHSTSCFQCNFTFSDKLLEYMKTSFKICVICGEKKKKDEYIIILPCGDIFCNECFKLTKKYHFNDDRSMIENITKCLKCNLAISSYQYNSLFNKIELNKIIVSRMNEVWDPINCHKCKFQFQVINKTRKQRCPSCEEFTCEVCKEKFHGIELDCWSNCINERLRELESLDEEGVVTQCPGCRTPYLSLERCCRIECMNEKCGVSFCSRCACFLEPALHHGNHYHRPDCDYYSAYDFDVEYEDKCKRCKNLGKLCPRPKRLKIPRRVDIDEVEKII